MNQFLFLVMAVSFVGSSLAKAPKDPSHGGKPLSAWVREIAADEQGKPFFNTNAVEAIRSTGTNGLPWLLMELKVTDSPMYGSQASEALPILEEELRQLTSGANRAAITWKRKPEFERVLNKAIAQIRNGENSPGQTR